MNAGPSQRKAHRLEPNAFPSFGTQGQHRQSQRRHQGCRLIHVRE